MRRESSGTQPQRSTAPPAIRGERRELDSKRPQDNGTGATSTSGVSNSRGSSSGDGSSRASGAGAATGTTYRKLNGWSFGDTSQGQYNIPTRPSSRGNLIRRTFQLQFSTINCVFIA